MSITHLGKIGHINVYYDPLQEKDRLLFGFKSESAIEQAVIWLPHTPKELLEIAIKYQKDHKNDIVKIPERSKEDYDFVIGNSMDLKIYKETIKLLK